VRDDITSLKFLKRTQGKIRTTLGEPFEFRDTHTRAHAHTEQTQTVRALTLENV